jgi:hypothetical protein
VREDQEHSSPKTFEESDLLRFFLLRRGGIEILDGPVHPDQPRDVAEIRENTKAFGNGSTNEDLER